jgi:hypothetical protein
MLTQNQFPEPNRHIFGFSSSTFTVLCTQAQDHILITIGDALRELLKKASIKYPPPDDMMVQCYGPKVDITKALTSNSLIE